MINPLYTTCYANATHTPLIYHSQVLLYSSVLRSSCSLEISLYRHVGGWHVHVHEQKKHTNPSSYPPSNTRTTYMYSTYTKHTTHLHMNTHHTHMYRVQMTSCPHMGVPLCCSPTPVHCIRTLHSPPVTLSCSMLASHSWGPLGSMGGALGSMGGALGSMRCMCINQGTPLCKVVHSFILLHSCCSIYCAPLSFLHTYMHLSAHIHAHTLVFFPLPSPFSNLPCPLTHTQHRYWSLFFHWVYCV